MAEYENGYHCFSCHGDFKKKEVGRFKPEVIVNQDKQLHLPFDATYSIEQKGKAWLYKYYLTDQVIRKNNICWSQSGKVIYKKEFSYPECLIFPIQNANGELVSYEMRSFAEGNKIKYITK
jgi:hypothetical protein